MGFPSGLTRLFTFWSTLFTNKTVYLYEESSNEVFTSQTSLSQLSQRTFSTSFSHSSLSTLSSTQISFYSGFPQLFPKNSPTQRNILLIIQRDPWILPSFLALLKWLILDQNLAVFIEPWLYLDKDLKYDATFQKLKRNPLLGCFKLSQNGLDFAICLGGEQALLYAASMLYKRILPIMSFTTGPVNFFAPLAYDNFRGEILNFLQSSPNSSYFLEYPRLQTYLSTENEGLMDMCLKEILLLQGPLKTSAKITIEVNGQSVCTGPGDGIVIALAPITATNETVPSGNGSPKLTKPLRSSIILTNVRGESSILLLEKDQLTISVPETEVGKSLWLSFEGRYLKKIKAGERVIISVSKFPVKLICSKYQKLSAGNGEENESSNWNGDF